MSQSTSEARSPKIITTYHCVPQIIEASGVDTFQRECYGPTQTRAFLTDQVKDRKWNRK